MKIILIMGLPGSGKTTLASELVPLLRAKWLNADEVRKEANDWDFSAEGRTRQAKRMWTKAQEYKNQDNHVVADFVCPTPAARKLFPADYVIWVDTIKEGRFDDTNKMFVKPEKYDFHVTTQDAKNWAPKIYKEINKKTGQVCNQIRDVQCVEDKPIDFDTVKKKIEEKLTPEFEGRFKIMMVPNITNICYGRGVGYKIEEIELSKEIQEISATKILSLIHI